MALDTSPLRTIDDGFPAIKEQKVTLIRITNKQVTQACSVTDKRELLSSLKPADTLIALWNGQRHTDAFQVPTNILTRWKDELLDGRR